MALEQFPTIKDDRTLEGTLSGTSSEQRTLPKQDNIGNFKNVINQIGQVAHATLTPSMEDELGGLRKAGLKMASPAAISAAVQAGTMSRQSVVKSAFDQIGDLILQQEEKLKERQKMDFSFASGFLNMVVQKPELLSYLKGTDLDDLKNGNVSDDFIKRIAEAASSLPDEDVETQVVDVGGKKLLINSATGDTIKDLGLSDTGGVSDAQVRSLAESLYQDDQKSLGGRYDSFSYAMNDARSTLGGGYTVPVGFVTSATGMRTDRHNNPTAMTVDVARTLGLTEGVDYTAGDPFDGGVTARLIGDPIEVTLKALNASAAAGDRSAFYTQSGKQRWTHTAMTDKDWESLSDEGRRAVVIDMYRKEGGSGELVGGAVQPGSSPEYSLDVETYAREYIDSGKLPTGLSQSGIAKVIEAARSMSKPDGMVYSVITGVKPDSVSSTQIDGISALRDVQKKAQELLELDKERWGGLVSGVVGKVLGSEDQAAYIALRNEIVDLLARARSGAALTTNEEKRYSSMLPSRFDEMLFLGADSQVRINNFIKNITSSLDTSLETKGLGIVGYESGDKVKTVNGKKYELINGVWQLIG